MNSTLSKASLIFIAGAPYKASEAYMAKPATSFFTFTRAGATATRINSAGLIEVVSANVPRLDYYPQQSCPTLLLEDDAVNLTTYSADLTNIAYVLFGATIAANSAASPMVGDLADKLTEDVSTGLHGFAKNTELGGAVDSSPYCISLFLKASGRQRVQMFDNAQNASGLSVFDLSTGTVVSGTGKIQLYGNGYYRCTIFPLKNFSTTSVAFVRLIDTGTNTSYTGDGVSGVLAFGMQVATSLTSYIQTKASTVTRNVEILTLSAATALIGQTEGTIFVEVLYDASTENRAPTAGQPIIGVGTDGNNYSTILLQGGNDGAQSNRVLSYTANGGVAQSQILSAAQVSGVVKIAYTYAAGSFKLFINGVKVGEELSGTVPTGGNIFFGNSSAAGALFAINLKTALLLKAVMPEAEAIELTTI